MFVRSLTSGLKSAKPFKFIRRFSTTTLKEAKIEMPIHEYIDKRVEDKFFRLESMIKSIDDKVNLMNEKVNNMQKNLPWETAKLLLIGTSIIGGTIEAIILVTDRVTKNLSSKDKN